jgi:hypothetical protein
LPPSRATSRRLPTLGAFFPYSVNGATSAAGSATLQGRKSQ